jgi:phosphatidylinositol alpha 1,6-mannosyltransferase
MIASAPRVAFFPDSFHEVNGVAHTSRHFERFARSRKLPFLSVRAGNRMPRFAESGSISSLELPRGFLSIPLEKDLSFDPAFLRHFPLILETFERFEPDLVHITGPSEMGLLGTALAHRYGLPLAASWHTNVHEYLARRVVHLMSGLTQRQATSAGKVIEDCALAIATTFYSAAQILFAPNLELCRLLEDATGRPCHLMTRGVDTVLFDPCKRSRIKNDEEIVLGYVGRLSVEKNVSLLADVQRDLDRIGRCRFRFLIVGHGGAEHWLRAHLPRAEFAGVLRGEALAEAYANMDLFVFPSHTDTFGNVVLEALASGVPSIVTREGGPASIVRDGVTGRVAADQDFAAAIDGVLERREHLAEMRVNARNCAVAATWDAVFASVYSGYESILKPVPNDFAGVVHRI